MTDIFNDAEEVTLPDGTRGYLLPVSRDFWERLNRTPWPRHRTRRCGFWKMKRAKRRRK